MIEAQAPQRSVCQSFTCGEVFDGAAGKCPKCGGPALTEARMRTLGWVVVVCGAVVGAVALFGAAFIVPSILAGGAEVNGTSFSGTASDAVFSIGVLVLLAAISAVVILAGLYQARNGRKNPMLFKVMIGLVVVFMVLGWLVKHGLMS